MRVLVLLVVMAFCLTSCKKDKTAYIDIRKVFNGFKYKQEVEKELTDVKNKRKFTLDSMEAQLKALSNKVKNDMKNEVLINQFQTEKELYLKQKYVFEEDEESMIKAYDEKIISQLNSYVKAYGKENNYTMIFGATNDGSVMYADESKDITKEVTEFINNKYVGQ